MGYGDGEQETAKAGMKLPMALRSKDCVDRFEWGEARRYFRNLCLHLVTKRWAWIGPDGKRRVLLTEDDGWVGERSIPLFIRKTPGFCYRAWDGPPDGTTISLFSYLSSVSRVEDWRYGY